MRIEGRIDQPDLARAPLAQDEDAVFDLGGWQAAPPLAAEVVAAEGAAHRAAAVGFQIRHAIGVRTEDRVVGGRQQGDERTGRWGACTPDKPMVAMPRHVAPVGVAAAAQRREDAREDGFSLADDGDVDARVGQTRAFSFRGRPRKEQRMLARHFGPADHGAQAWQVLFERGQEAQGAFDVPEVECGADDIRPQRPHGCKETGIIRRVLCGRRLQQVPVRAFGRARQCALQTGGGEHYIFAGRGYVRVKPRQLQQEQSLAGRHAASVGSRAAGVKHLKRELRRARTRIPCADPRACGHRNRCPASGKHKQ